MKKNYKHTLEQPDERETVPTIASGEAGGNLGLASGGCGFPNKYEKFTITRIESDNLPEEELIKEGYLSEPSP